MLAHAEGAQFQLAETYAYRGDAGAAFRWLEAAVNHDPGLV
jgi:Tfp pilus assembly protein PilF